MNPRNVVNVALDVLREAIASRYLIVLFGLIALSLLALTFALDIEVVNGAIAAGKVFGGSFAKGMAAGDFLAPMLSGLAYAVFYGGTLFLVVAVADIAPRMLLPGRVELLLALPLRRIELVVGIYLGVVLLAALAAGVAVGGASLVLFVKVEMVTAAPLMGALTALVGFGTVYGCMLAVAAIARSPALSAGAAILVFLVGVATSDRGFVLSLIRSGTTREVASVLMGPLPRLASLADVGADIALRKPMEWGPALSVIGGCGAFGLFFVVVACIVVSVRDY